MGKAPIIPRLSQSDPKKSYLEALYAWRRIHWDEYKEKSSYEWRFAYALWAALLGASSLVIIHEQELPQLPYTCFFVPIVLFLVIFLHIIFLNWIHDRLHKIRKKLNCVDKKIEKLLCPNHETCEDQKDEEDKKGSISRKVQIVTRRTWQSR